MTTEGGDTQRRGLRRASGSHAPDVQRPFTLQSRTWRARQRQPTCACCSQAGSLSHPGLSFPSSQSGRRCCRRTSEPCRMTRRSLRVFGGVTLGEQSSAAAALGGTCARAPDLPVSAPPVRAELPASELPRALSIKKFKFGMIPARGAKHTKGNISQTLSPRLPPPRATPARF